MTNSMLYGWRADFYNRSRQTSYLVILLFMVLLTLFFFPVSEASYQTLEINGYRGIYNSAWMGSALATLEVLFLPIICFYLVKNAVEGDRNSGVGELIASTPVSKFSYLAGKWLSNLSLLIGIGAVMVITTALVQLWIGEDYHIQILPLLLPQILFVLPVLAAIAGFALLFEMLPWLRGGFGNMAYFFLWVALIANNMEGPAGVGQIMQQMELAVNTIDPTSQGQSNNVGITVNDKATPLKTFIWQGLDYNLTLWLSMAMMLGFALMIFLFSTLFFDRFSRSTSSQNQAVKNKVWIARLAPLGHKISLIISRITEYSPLLSMIHLECLLMLKGRPVLLYFVLVGLVIAQLFVDIDTVRSVLVPVSLLLCALLISPLGQREMHQHTYMLVFTCCSPLKKQLIAMLGAGTLILLVSVSAALFRYIVLQDFAAISSLLVGLIFTVALAICCASLTRTSRTFEIFYTFLWYVGPMQQQSYLDFIGTDPSFSQSHQLPVIFLFLSMFLMGLAAIGRKAQMTNTR